MHLYVSGVELVEISLPQSVSCLTLVMGRRCFVTKGKSYFKNSTILGEGALCQKT